MGNINETILSGMYIKTDTIFSMIQANQNFSQVTGTVDKICGAVVFKNNMLMPVYFLLCGLI